MAAAFPLPVTISVVLSDSTKMGCELLCSALDSSNSGMRVLGIAVNSKDLVQVVLSIVHTWR